MVVVDAGAYVGYFTLLASRLVGPSGRVFAFEPNPVGFRYLTDNVEQNACENVLILPRALSSSSGRLQYVPDPAGAESFIHRAASDQPQTSVEGESLDDFLRNQFWPTIDLVKMDIEGSEFAALTGMTETSSRNPKLQLIMEFNASAMDRSLVSRHELAAVLNKLGFRKGYVIEQGLREIPGGLLPETNAVCNLLLTKVQ
jgi:FkbM family methyltransferase